MKKTKTEKGITLIALLITIVVLLILAAVAISSITNDNILGYATNTAKDYNAAVKNEQSEFGKYDDFLHDYTTTVTAPTEISVVQVTNSTIVVKAIGGTGKGDAKVAGYQYSTDGTTWSETFASDTNYTFQEIPETIYARTISEEEETSKAINIEIISFDMKLEAIGNVKTTYYAINGMNWFTWVSSPFCLIDDVFCDQETDAVYDRTCLNILTKKFIEHVNRVDSSGIIGGYRINGSDLVVDGGYYANWEGSLGKLPLW